MKVLVVSKDLEQRAKVAFSIEGTYRNQVLEADTYSNALEGISSGSKIDLLIVDSSAGTTVELEEFRKKTAEIPVIIWGSNTSAEYSPSWNVVGVVDRGALIKNLLEVLGRLSSSGTLVTAGVVPPAGVTVAAAVDPNYCKIRTKILLSVCPLKGDLYIRLSEIKFLKLMREGDVFDLDDLSRYTSQKGIDYLYIRKEETQNFIDKYKTELERIFQGVHRMDVAEVASLGESIQETVQELGKRLGFTKDVQIIAKTHVRMAVKSLGNSPNLAHMLKKLEGFKGQYISAHSTLCGYIACAIASHMEWGSEATFHKLMLAAFLHDIALDDHALARYSTAKQAESGGLTEAQLKVFKGHSIEAAEIAKRFKEVPPDVDQIIMQHHELPDGTGFPRGINHVYISSLSAVFMISHDMADHLLVANDATFNFQAFLDSVREKYKSQQMRKILAIVEHFWAQQGGKIVGEASKS